MEFEKQVTDILETLKNLMVELAKEQLKNRAELQRFTKENESLKMFVNNKNEQIQQIKQDLNKVKESIILSKENARHDGRPPLTGEEIDLIRHLLAQGLTIRKVAENVGVSPSTAHKYSKMFDNNTKEQFQDKKESSVGIPDMNLFGDSKK